MRRSKTPKWFAAVILLCCLAAAGHGYADAPKGPAGEEERIVANRVVVMPFENMTRIHGKKRTVRGPVTRKVFVTGDVAPKAELVMDEVLAEFLSQQTGVQWLAPETGDRVSLTSAIQSAAMVKALQVVGQRHHADAVLVGYLYAYRERVGGALGAERSAMVAFELALVRVKNGGIMWRSGFAESQQALNENILNIGKFIRRRGRWVTARAMVKQAMQEMLQSIPLHQVESSSETIHVD